MKNIKSFAKKQWTMLCRNVSEVDWISFGFWTTAGCVFVALAPQDAKGYAIAASVALFIAFVAYPWQRGRDRANELRKEQRETYRKFLHVWSDVQHTISEVRKKLPDDVEGASTLYGEVLRKADNCVFDVALCGSPAVLEQLTQMHTTLYDSYRSYGEEIKSLYQESGETVPIIEIGKIFLHRLKVQKQIERPQFQELLSRMRSEEFEGAGLIIIEDPEALFYLDVEEDQT